MACAYINGTIDINWEKSQQPLTQVDRVKTREKQMLLKINDIIAFIIELASIALYVKWAYSIPEMKTMKIVFSIFIVMLFAIIWGTFFAPNAKYSLTENIRWFLEFFILFLPSLQFINDKLWITIIVGLIIIVNLFIQAKFGRGNW